MKLFHIPIYILLFFLSLSVAAQTKTAISNGNWNNAGTWSPSGVPGDNDVILIPAGVTVIIPNNQDIVLDNVVLVIQGELYMDQACFIFCSSSSLTLTGSTSGIIIEAGGQITDDPALGLFDATIVIDGVQFWSSNALGDGTFGPEVTDTSWPDGTNNPLPIELLEFKAVLSGDNVQVTWATASEINNDFFTIERSEDGSNWKVIHEEAGAGHSTMRMDYSFIDSNPIPGISYYRLKQTDYDGVYAYFDPAVVLYEAENLFQVFPNPTPDILHIRTSSDLSQASILVRNLDGQPIAVKAEVATHIAELDISTLPEGIYVLEIVFAEIVLRKRVVKR